jgi:restriction system protein
LVSIIEGAATYETRSAFPVAAQPPAWLNLPKFALWHVGENDAGSISMKSLGRANTEIHEMFS